MVRPSQVVIADKITRNVSQVFVGLVFMAVGFFVGWFGLNREPHNDKLLYVGIALGVLGGMVMPGLFEVVRPIYITFFPNGLPLIGGRRVDDPPKGPPQPPPAEG